VIENAHGPKGEELMGNIPPGLSVPVRMANSASVDEGQLTALISAVRSQKSRVTGSSVAPSGPQTNHRSVVLDEGSALVELTEANQVWTTPTDMLDSSKTDSLHNWAQFYFNEFNDVDNASASVAFYFYFKNPSPDYVTVLSPPVTSLTASGIISAEANGAITPDSNTANFDAVAYFRVYTPASAPSSISYIETDYALGGNRAAGGEISNDNKKLNCDVTGQSLSLLDNIELAPDAYALFEVMLQVTYSIDGDSGIILDFASSDDYEFSCTEVKFDILTNNLGGAGAQPTSTKGTTIRG
jgi:hypothetical protein